MDLLTICELCLFFLFPSSGSPCICPLLIWEHSPGKDRIQHWCVWGLNIANVYSFRIWEVEPSPEHEVVQ